MEYKFLTPQYDADLVGVIRSSLKAHQLDIPGTVYFDEGLDHLSGYYDDPGRAFVSSFIGKQKEPAMQTPLSWKMSIMFMQRSCNMPQAVPLSVLRISS